MDGDMEEGTRLEGRNEASHRRQAKRTSAAAVGDFGVRDDMAAYLEFLQGHSGVTARGEEKHVPIVVAHDDERSTSVRSGRGGEIVVQQARVAERGAPMEDEQKRRLGGGGARKSVCWFGLHEEAGNNPREQALLF